MKTMLPDDYFSRTPLASLLVYLALRIGLSANDVLDRFAQVTLREMADTLDRLWQALHSLTASDCSQLLAAIRAKLSGMCFRVDQRDSEPDTGSLPQPGETTLQSELQKYERDPLHTIEYWEKSVEELSLIARALQREDGAFENLIKPYAKAVYGRIRARVWNDEDANDLQQEVWLKVWKQLPNFNPGRAFFACFVNQIVSNVLGDYWRRIPGPNLTHLSLDEDGNPIEGLDDSGAPPDEELMACEICMLMLRRLFAPAHPPHELLTFILVRILGNMPREVIDQFSRDTGLGDLSQLCRQDLAARFGLKADETAGLFERLSQKLDEPFQPRADVAHTDSMGPPSRLSSTVLRQHFSQQCLTAPDWKRAAAKEIDGWLTNVRKRVLADGDDGPDSN